MIKQTTLSLTFFVGFSSALYAQSFYLKLGGGYAFPFASEVVGTRHHDQSHLTTNPETGFYDLTSLDSRQSVVRGTFGTGATPSLTLGYEFNDRIAAEIGLGYVVGPHYDFASIDEEVIDREDVRYSTRRGQSWHARHAFIAPSVKFIAGQGKLQPYVTAGPVLAMTSIEASHDYYSNYHKDPESSETVEEYKGGIALGARGGAGVDLKLSNSFYLFSEVVFTGMSYYPAEREILKYTVNGEDHMNTLPRSERFKHFVKNKNRSTGAGQYAGSEELQVQFNMNSLAATIGIKVMI